VLSFYARYDFTREGGTSTGPIGGTCFWDEYTDPEYYDACMEQAVQDFEALCGCFTELSGA
jgi:hypothetical protein